MMARYMRLTRGVAAAVALVALVAGVPYGLSRAAGWPMPRSVPTWTQITDIFSQPGVPDAILLDALAIVCWIAWGMIAIALIAEVVAVARGRAAPRLRFAGPLQVLMAGLVATVLLTLLTTSSRATAPVSPLRVGGITASLGATVAAPKAHQARPDVAHLDLQSSERQAPVVSNYTVQRRDTLWGIAKAHLGDPLRWREVFDLNVGRRQPDGGTLDAARLIRPGWVLHLPAVASGAPAAPALTSLQPATPTPSPRPTQEPAPSAQSTRGLAPIPTAVQSASSSAVFALPDGSVVGIALATGIGTALAGARLRRRHRRVVGEPRPGMSHTESGIGPVPRRLRRAQLDTPLSGSASTSVTAEHTLVMGVEDAQPIHLNIRETSSLALTGEGYLGAARAALLALLTSGGEAVEIRFTDPDTAHALFPAAPTCPTVSVAQDVESALSAIEIELVLRTRLLDAADACDASEFRAKRPYEPFPRIVLCGHHFEGTARQRMEAVASIGRRLDIGVLVVGEPWAQAIDVAGDGVVTSVVGDGMGRFSGAQLFTLTSDAATQCLAVVAESQSIEPVQPLATPDMPADDGDVFVVRSSNRSGESEAPLVEVSVLGTFRIEANGRALRTGLRTKARELFAYLILHPQGVTADVAIELLWPDGDAERGMVYFHAIIGNIRKVLRDATGRSDATFIEWRGDRYTIDPCLIDSDFWRVQSALDTATKAADVGSQIAALATIGGNYRGDLLDGATYEWSEAIREDIRRRAVDGLVRLADLYGTTEDGDRVVSVLECALRADPYCEDLYRRIMQAHASLKRPDAIRRTYRLLEKRLAEIDADPDDLTLAMLHRLTMEPASASA